MPILLFGGRLLLFWVHAFLRHVPRRLPAVDQYSETQTAEMSGRAKSKAIAWRGLSVARGASTDRRRVRFGLRNLSKCTDFLNKTDMGECNDALIFVVILIILSPLLLIKIECFELFNLQLTN